MLSPLALLWLLPIGGVITLLYLLKQKRQERTVPSLLLWEQVLQETSSNAPFQRLRYDLLFILQLIAALLFVITLARPFFLANTLGGKTVAIVLDGSASMNARDVSGGRFAAGVSEARKLIQNKAATDRIAIVLAGARPETLSPLTTDRGKLLSSLSKAAPSDSVIGPREALLLAGSLVSSQQDAAVTFITDGVFARQDELTLGGASLKTVIVGKSGENVGITAFDVRETESEDGTAGWEAFISLHNSGTQPRTLPIELRAGDKLIEAQEATVAPGDSQSLIIPLSISTVPQDADVLTASIESNDQLPADNRAYAALPSHTAIHVLLVTEDDDPFLERGLSLVPRVTVSKTSPASFTPQTAKANDLTLWDSDTTPPDDLPRGRYLFFSAITTGSVAPVRVSENKQTGAATVLDFDRTSPLLRFTDLSGVRIREAHKVTPAPWASVIAEGKEGPLVVAGEHGGSRTAYVAFRPTQSDFPLRVAFPVFIANTVSYLMQGDGTDAVVLRPGASIPLPGGTITVTRPNGKRETVSGNTYDRADTIGIYTISGNNTTRRFGVALLSATESDITPVPSPLIPVTDTAEEGKDTDRKKPSESPRELWPYFAIPLLILLAVEWFLFHRVRR